MCSSRQWADIARWKRRRERDSDATELRTEREQQQKKSSSSCWHFISRHSGWKTVISSGEMPGMMDKGSEYLGKGRSNGTKSPSNASNGHFSDESGSDDEHGEYSLEQPLVALCVRALDVNTWIKMSRVFDVDVLQMWGCGLDPIIRPTFPSSSPVSFSWILPEWRTVVASVPTVTALSVNPWQRCKRTVYTKSPLVLMTRDGWRIRRTEATWTSHWHSFVINEI